MIFQNVKGFNISPPIAIFSIKSERKSMCWKIYNPLLNISWQALASSVRNETAFYVFVIHSLHTPEGGAYCALLACHEVGPSAFSSFRFTDSLESVSPSFSPVSKTIQHNTSQTDCQLSLTAPVRVKRHNYCLHYRGISNQIYNRHFHLQK